MTLSEWTHVALTVGYTTSTSISFYINGSASGQYDDLATLILDDCGFSHYIGGIRHQWRLYDAFRGFIYEFNVA